MFCCFCGQPEGEVSALTFDDASEAIDQAAQSVVTGAVDIQVFKAPLKRKSLEQPWGISVDTTDSSAVHIHSIRTIGSTVVREYNEKAHPDKVIRGGDYIIAANGVNTRSRSMKVGEENGMSSWLREVLKYELELTLQRPHIFECVMKRNGDLDEQLGLDLNFSPGDGSVVIQGVSERGVASRSVPEVQPLDRIVAVDGVAGAPSQLVEACTDGKSQLQLTISRCV